MFAIATCFILVMAKAPDWAVSFTAFVAFFGSLAAIAGLLLFVGVIGGLAGTVVHAQARAALASLRGLRDRHARRALAIASRLLPHDVRDEHLEEWTAWLLDLRRNGTPRVRWWVELLSLVLVAAPQLAVVLRMRTGREVDR
nr:hypothetical protein [Kibdelosporangium sp. MJ126-NF4]CTQ89100.1 hypothetical protein [Kibdelosporangium sp. MJ126-NF4]